MEEKCYFAKEPPAVEVRGGLVFIKPAGSHCEVAVSPHTMRKFIRATVRALDAFDAANKVVPLRASG